MTWHLEVLKKLSIKAKMTNVTGGRNGLLYFSRLKRYFYRALLIIFRVLISNLYRFLEAFWFIAPPKKGGKFKIADLLKSGKVPNRWRCYFTDRRVRSFYVLQKSAIYLSLILASYWQLPSECFFLIDSLLKSIEYFEFYLFLDLLF